MSRWLSMEIINVRLPDKIVSDLDKLAKRHNLNRSEVMRQALTLYLHIVENVGTMLRPIIFQVKPGQIAYINVIRGSWSQNNGQGKS